MDTIFGKKKVYRTGEFEENAQFVTYGACEFVNRVPGGICVSFGATSPSAFLRVHGPFKEGDTVIIGAFNERYLQTNTTAYISVIADGTTILTSEDLPHLWTYDEDTQKQWVKIAGDCDYIDIKKQGTSDSVIIYTVSVYGFDDFSIVDIPVTQSAEHEEEMMKSDFVKLSWDDSTFMVLPPDSYILFNDPRYPSDEALRYSLLEPYEPEQKAEDHFHYEPHFQHPKMYLGKVPFTVDGVDDYGNHIDNIDWPFVGTVTSLLEYFCDAINKALGLSEEEGFAYSLVGEVKNSVNAQFSSQDILSALNTTANACECEYHLDWRMKTLFFGKNIVISHQQVTRPVLEVGKNITNPSTRDSKEGFWNAFIPQGSNKNVVRIASTSEAVQAKVRVALQPSTEYTFTNIDGFEVKMQIPDGTVYTDDDGYIISKEKFEETQRKKYVKAVIFDEVYPRQQLYVYDVRKRELYVNEEGKGEDSRVIERHENGVPIYKKWTTWYIKLAQPTIVNGHVTSWEKYELDGYVSSRTFGSQTPHESGNYYHYAVLMDDFSLSDEGKMFYCLYHEEIIDEQGRRIIWHLFEDGIGIRVRVGDTTYECRLCHNSQKTVLTDAELSAEKFHLWFDRAYDTADEARQDPTGVAFLAAANTNREIVITGLFDEKQTHEFKDPAQYVSSTVIRSLVINGKEAIMAFQPNTYSREYSTGSYIYAQSTPLAGRGSGDGDSYGFKFGRFLTEEDAKAARTIRGNDVVSSVDQLPRIEVGDFEIIMEESGDYRIPSNESQGLIPKGAIDIYGHEQTTIQQMNGIGDDGQTGNIVTIYNIMLDSSYEKNAEHELAGKISEYIKKQFIDNNSRTFKSDPVLFYEDNPRLYIGMPVTFKDVNGTALTTRVMKLITKIDHPFEQEITVGNEILKGQTQQLKETVDTLVSGGSNGTGGGISGAIRSQIQAWVQERFLSKVSSDTASDSIGFLKGLWVKAKNLFGIDENGDAHLRNIDAYGDLSVGGDTTIDGILQAFIKILTNHMESDNFTDEGSFGTGFRLMKNDADGVTSMVVDNLFVRMKAIFTELEIRKISYAGGNIIFSHAGSKIVRVEAVYNRDGMEFDGDTLILSDAIFFDGDFVQTDNGVFDLDTLLSNEGELKAFRCYLLADDGTTATENWWQVNDQARCQTFNIDEGEHENVSNQSYWRKVIKTDSKVLEDGKKYDYVDLSVSDAIQGSTIPAAGDVIVQMGNRTDISRQGFISMEVYDEDGTGNAPSIKVYKRVDSFSLDNKMKICISPHETSISLQKLFIETEYDVQRVPMERGEWEELVTYDEHGQVIVDEHGNIEHRCYYYNIVQHNGASWLCTYPDSGTGGVKYTLEEPSDTADYWQSYAQKGETGQSTFKSTAFIRTNNDMSLLRPIGGSYASPLPTSTYYDDETGLTISYSDGIPAGDAKLWAVTRKFTSDGETPQDSQWSLPRPMTDTDFYDVEFAKMQSGDATPPAPTDANRHGGSGIQIWFDPTLDPLEDFTKMYWRAERECKNGKWGSWTILRIKGEKGDEGQRGEQGPSGDSPIIVYKWNDDKDVAPSVSGHSYPPSGWSTDIPTQGADDTYLWMSESVRHSNGTIDDWGTPVRISGADGQPGVDSSETEYIYKLSDTQPSTPPNPSDRTIDGFVPTGWSASAQSVDENHKTLYCSMRKKDRGSTLWGDFSIPYVWSHWGRNGADGDGIEYVYIRTKNDVAPVLDTVQAGYEEAEFLPFITNNAQCDAEVNTGTAQYPKCTDSPKGPNATYMYEWCISRSMSSPNSEGVRTWQKFASPMKKWSNHAESITKSSETITYKVSDSGTTQPTGTWYSTKQAAIDAYNAAQVPPITDGKWKQGTYMWTHTDILWSDDTHTHLYSDERNPNDGQAGQDIIVDGATVMKYAVTNDNTTTPTTWYDYADIESQIVAGTWLWTQATTYYRKSGSPAGSHDAGSSVNTTVSYNGTDGAEGRAVLSSSEHYKASPLDGSDAQHSETAPTRDADEWDTNPNVPDAQGHSQWNETNKYLWNYERVTYSKGTLVERTTPRIIAIWTKDGKGIDSITNYYAVNNSATTAPTAEWKDNPMAPTESDPYLWNYEVITWTDGTTTGSVADAHIIGHFGKDGQQGVGAFTIDLDNEADAYGTDSTGKVIDQQTRTTNVKVYLGTTEQVISGFSVTLKDSNGGSIGSSIGTATGVLSADSKTLNVSVVVKSNNVLSDAKYDSIYADINISVQNVGNKSARFTVQQVRSGAPGISPTIYQLMPTESALVYGRNLDNTFVARVGSTKINVQGTTGSDVETYTTQMTDYQCLWNYSDVSGRPNPIAVGTTITVSATDAASHDSLWVELWKKSDLDNQGYPLSGKNPIDKETIPFNKEGAYGSSGKDAVNILLTPENVILTQNTDSPYAIPCDNAYTQVSLLEGDTPKSGFTIGNVTPSTETVGGTSYPTCSARLRPNTNIVEITQINSYSQSGKSYYFDHGYVTFNVNYNDKSYEKRFSFYVNLLGTWKETIENDVKHEIATSTFYFYDSAGNLVANETIGDYIKSSTQNISKLQAFAYADNLIGEEGWVDENDDPVSYDTQTGLIGDDSDDDIYSPNIHLKAGKYIFSAYVTESNDTDLYIERNGSFLAEGITYVDEYYGGKRRAFITLNTPIEADYRFNVYSVGGNADFYRPMLTKGEELTSYVKQGESAATTSKVEQTADHIIQQVNGTGINIETGDVLIHADKFKVTDDTGNVNLIEGVATGGGHLTLTNTTVNGTFETEATVTSGEETGKYRLELTKEGDKPIIRYEMTRNERSGTDGHSKDFQYVMIDCNMTNDYAVVGAFGGRYVGDIKSVDNYSNIYPYQMVAANSVGGVAIITNDCSKTSEVDIVSSGTYYLHGFSTHDTVGILVKGSSGEFVRLANSSSNVVNGPVIDMNRRFMLTDRGFRFNKSVIWYGSQTTDYSEDNQSNWLGQRGCTTIKLARKTSTGGVEDFYLLLYGGVIVDTTTDTQVVYDWTHNVRS